MHGLIHARRRNTPKVFQGRSSRLYDLLSRRVLRGMYRRLAADVAGVAPDGGAVLDVGTGPGVLLVELAARRPDLRLTGVDLSPDMITAATRNLEPFGERARAFVGDVTTLTPRCRSWRGSFARLAGFTSTTSRSHRSTRSPTPPGPDRSSMDTHRNV